MQEQERAEALSAMDAIVDDFFAFRAAACTAQDDCNCGRSREEHAFFRGEETEEED